jgi:hypothetical protein
MNKIIEGILASADFKLDKNGRKYPAKRIRMGEKEHVTEASYKGNIGVMELAKFHSSASPEQKQHFVDLMKKKSASKSEKEQSQMAAQIWRHVQKVTGVKLHQMENTQMLSFKSLLESKEDFILQSLADKDINASIKDGKVVVHDHTQHAKAKNMVKRMGMPHEVVKGVKEDLDESFDWHKHNGDWDKAKTAGKKFFDDEMAKSPNKTDAALKLKNQAAVEHKKGSYTAAVVKGHVEDYFDRQLRDDVNVDHTSTVVLEATQPFNFTAMVQGYVNHKSTADKAGIPCLTMEEYAAEFVELEEVTSKIVVPIKKPRDPNYKTLLAKKNASGAHRDKKKEFKAGKSRIRPDADFL